MFRPVALTLGPDGCVYIVDWYNKIISHNEVPRNHPERDKIRGRIWRVKPKANAPFTVPDFTKLSGEQLLAKLGDDSLAQSHLAWQTIIDSKRTDLEDELQAIVTTGRNGPAAAIQALWALEGLLSPALDYKFFESLLVLPNRNLRREAIRILGDLTVTGSDYNQPVPAEGALSILGDAIKDPDPQVRAEAARVAGLFFNGSSGNGAQLTAAEQTAALKLLLSLAQAPLADPTAPSSHKAQNIIKVGPAYEREFERYLVRLALEKRPEAVAAFLDSPDAANLSVEARLLATLALEPKASALRVAQLLPQLQRAPEPAEVLRLVEHLNQPKVVAALQQSLQQSKTRLPVLQSLLDLRSRLDAKALAPLITASSQQLLQSKDTTELQLGLQLAAGFQLTTLEPLILDLAKSSSKENALAALRALAEIGTSSTSWLAADFDQSTDTERRQATLIVLASSRSPEAATLILDRWAKLSSQQHRDVLGRLATTPAAAKAIVAALQSNLIPIAEVEASLLDRLQALLPQDPGLANILESSAHLFRPILVLNGKEDAWTQTDLILDGPLTVETWVRLDATSRTPSNADGILGSPGQVDLNFYGGRFRVYAFPPLGDVVTSSKTILPDVWTHVAATRSREGIWTLYQDGEPIGVSTKPALSRIENPRLAWSTAPGGTEGALAETRIWKTERSGDAIRASFDRGLPDNTPDLVLNTSSDHQWGQLQPSAKIQKTSDLPPVLSADQAHALDTKFAKFRALAAKSGNAEVGKLSAMICMGCHLIKGQGAHIGPDLSGVGAMGTEAILRNILTPNAALESAYHIYRVELQDGSVKEGFLVTQDDQAIVLRTVGAADQRLPKSSVREAKFLRRSLMPEGLIDYLPDQQVIDLFAYLHSLK